MKSLGHIIAAVQELVNEFDGTVSIKNAHHKYFFVNDAWLQTMKLEREYVLGKTDDEIAPPANAQFIRKTDLEAAQKGIPMQYTNIALVNGVEINYTAIKWVVKHQNGIPFCYCTVAHLQEHKQKIMDVQQKIMNLMDSLVIEETDYTK